MRAPSPDSAIRRRLCSRCRALNGRGVPAPPWPSSVTLSRHWRRARLLAYPLCPSIRAHAECVGPSFPPVPAALSSFGRAVFQSHPPPCRLPASPLLPPPPLWLGSDSPPQRARPLRLPCASAAVCGPIRVRLRSGRRAPPWSPPCTGCAAPPWARLCLSPSRRAPQSCVAVGGR